MQVKFKSTKIKDLKTKSVIVEKALALTLALFPMDFARRSPIERNTVHVFNKYCDKFNITSMALTNF
jgi:hypothetical protein